jgi:predicted nucleotidyltransferase
MRGWIVTDLLKPLFNAEDQYAEKFLQAVSKKVSGSVLKKEILSVVVFGSVSRREEGPVSDLDLFIVIRDGRQKHAVENLFFEIDRMNIMKACMSVEPHVSALSEFQEKFRTGLPLIKNILKSNRVIYGRSLESLL